MKKVKADRYHKPREPRAEKIDFSDGSPVPPEDQRPHQTPQRQARGHRPHAQAMDLSNGRQAPRPAERSNGQTNGRPPYDPLQPTQDDAPPINSYVIRIPQPRRKVRRSFDVFDDQRLALDLLRMAIQDVRGEKPTLGDLVQEALDDYVGRRTDELPNVRMVPSTDGPPDKGSTDE